MDHIHEIFEHDPRPTFLVDLYKHERQTASYNQALHRHDGLLDALSATDSASSKFRGWWIDQGAEESHHWYKGSLWIKFTARKRWMVVCCLQASQMTDSPSDAVLDISPPLRNGELVKPTTRRQHGHKHIAERGAKNESIFNTTRSLSPELAQHIEYIRNIDWSKTSLGPMETWSHDLCQLLTLMMLETRPTAAFLGPDNVILYNLGYVAITGKRHPEMLGKRVTDAWPEVTDIARETITGSQGTHQADFMDKEYHLFLERSGFLEETFFKWALVPFVGPVVGLYSIVTEVTKERLWERRTSALLAVAQSTGAARDMKSFWRAILDGISSYEYDFSLAALYSLNGDDDLDSFSALPSCTADKQLCLLEGAHGIPEGHPIIPPQFDISKCETGIAVFLREAMLSQHPILLQRDDGTLPEHSFHGIECRGFGDPCRAAVVCPIRPANQDKVTGLLLIGLNTRRPYDAEYQEWVQILSKLLDSSAAAVALVEEGVRGRQIAVRKAARFQQVAEMVDVGFFDFDPNGRLVYANEAYYNLSGHPKDPDAHVDFSWVNFVHEEDISLCMGYWKKLEQGTPVTFEFRWRKPEGKGPDREPKMGVLWVLAACVPVIAKDGTLMGISGCTTDISAQKRSEQDAIQRAEALERATASEQRFAKFAEHALVAIFITDPEYKIQYCNDRWYEMTGCPRVPYDLINWRDTVLEEDVGIVERALKMLAKERIQLNVQFRVKRTWRSADGVESPAWMMAWAYPEHVEGGSAKTIVGTMIEISHLKWAESVQKIRVEEALESKRQQENFIDMTSHEMRNPLSAMVQCADSITTSLAEMAAITQPAVSSWQPEVKDTLGSLIDGSHDAIQTIISCLAHQRRIVDDILTLSKLDSKLLLITPVKVRPVAMVQDALKMFESEAQKAKVRLEFRQDQSVSDLGVDYVLLDPSRVLQVLINLLTNAIKFTRNQPTRNVIVSLSASKHRPSDNGNSAQYVPTKTLREDFLGAPEWVGGDVIYLYFSVEDTGCGLTTEEMSKLFMRFSQASPKTYIEYGGSGLGLFISRELVELQGGEIAVASEAGVGSTFSFYVKSRLSLPPRTDGDEAPGAAKRAPHPAPQSKSYDQYNILIVEDNLVNQKVLSTQLKKLGCTVHVAGHGGEALDFLKETVHWRGRESDGRPLSVILMDIEMPVMDGLACARSIRQLEHDGRIVGHVPIIAVSANARSEQINEAKAAGMDDAIAKPFRIPELMPKIECLVRPGKA